MRHVALIALACAGLAFHARSAAACELDENGEVEDCEADIEAFDERFDEEATFLDRMKLDLSGRFLRHVVIRWSDDDEDQYVEYEIETDFDGVDGTDGFDDGTDGFDGTDGYDGSDVDGTDGDSPDGSDVDDPDFDDDDGDASGRGSYTPDEIGRV